MPYVISVLPLDGFRLDVTFDDGTRGIVCLADQLFGPVFEPLREHAYFAQVFVDEFGAIAWPNGADLAPDALYDTLRAANGAVVNG